LAKLAFSFLPIGELIFGAAIVAFANLIDESMEVIKRNRRISSPVLG
jgi:hypothetical protein